MGSRHYMAYRSLSMGYTCTLAAGSHAGDGLQTLYGCRFALSRWVADELWLPVRTHVVGCRRSVAAGSHGYSGLQDSLGC